jgi:hypothetical protein
MSARRPASPLIERARAKKRAGKMSGAPPRSPPRSPPPSRVANTWPGRARQRCTKPLSSINFSCAKSTGTSSAAEEYWAARRPQRTELESPERRSAFGTQVTDSRRASRRKRAFAGGTTTLIPALRRPEASLRVRRSRLWPWTRARALGCPKREDSPAASTTTFKLGTAAFVAMIAHMNSSRVNLQHRPFLIPIWITAGVAAAAFLFALFVILIWVWASGDSSTLIVIPADPAAGAERSAQWARLFGAEQGPGRLNAIYAPPGSRPAAALAERLHIPLRDAPDTDAKALAHRALHEHGGGRVLVLATPDLFPGVVSALSGARDIPRLAGADLSVVYVVTVPRIGHATLVRLNY